jgi:PAS domain S-box-containing protein
MNALLVKDEAQRSHALEQDEALISATDPILDELTGLAAQICDTPAAVVCLIEPECLRLKAATGVTATTLSLESTPCAIAAQGDGICEVQDARLEPEFAPDGLLIDGQFFCFYAAAVLTNSSGTGIGTLAVLDVHPRQLTAAQAEALSTLSRQVIARLEMQERIRQMEQAFRLQEHSESAVTVEKNFVSAVLDTIGLPITVFDAEGRIVRFNRACEVISGHSFATLSGSFVWEHLVAPEEVPEAIESFRKLRDDVFPTNFESRWLNRDDRTIRRIAWSATALRDTDGQVVFILAAGMDVTTQQPVELTLRESEAPYRQLVESSLGMVFIHDTKGQLLSLNAHGAATVGRTSDEMVGHSLAEFIPAKRQTAIHDYLRMVSEMGEAQGVLHLSHSNGEVRVIAYRNKLITVPERAPYILGFGVDITEQVRAERKLRTLTRQSNSILESVGDGIFCIDLEGRVTVVNSAAAQMLGYRKDEMLGKVMHALIHHTKANGMTYPLEESPVRKSLSNFGTARVVNEIFWRKDGTCFPVEYVARPLIDSHASESGEVRAIGVVVAFTDTTERRALDRMKDEFISTVSHELRTPLTSLRGALGLLRGGALEERPEKSQQMLAIALNNTDRLVRLVNDILDLERISSGKSELHLTNVRAEDLLRRAASSYQAEPPEAGAQILFAPTDVSVWADPDRVLQVLRNLLSNAIKFSTSEGEIRMAVRSFDDNEALFEVRDQGRGIPADKLENIFDRFQQGDASDSRALGGTGLGLTICRRIINQHGGRIWATSAPGEGTTVHFTLPTQPRTNLR